jgi:hypothetical protein
MKNSTKNLQKLKEAETKNCNEKKCVICFENRGCIYDGYFMDAPSLKAENFPPGKEMVSVGANESSKVSM